MHKPNAPFREYFMLNMNGVVRLLIMSDVVWMGACGLLGPIFSLYIVEFIKGGNEAVAGTAAAIYLVTKSLLQIPAASIIDKIRGEKDDFLVMFIGSLMGALMPLLYLVISTPGQLYLVQFMYGAVIAFTFPSYMAIFTRHIDSGHEGKDWGVYFTLVDLCSAVTAAVGGVIAASIGYRPLIFIMVFISIVGVSFLFPIRKHIFKT
jgi:MFS family permease